MMGAGRAFGAVSVVNALAGGKGGTAGVRLETNATVKLEEARGGDWTVRVNGEIAESRLAVEVVASVLASCGRPPGEYGGEISTVSNIPMGVGLKSSSSSSGAIALAASAALGLKLSMRRLMLCSVESSLKAGVSVTGAFDDVAGCLLGGLNLSDNIRRRLVSSTRLRSLKVLIALPATAAGRRGTEAASLRRFSSLATAAFEMSLRGDFWNAMTVNGLIYSTILGYDPSLAMRALEVGALGAGLSGRGPAVAAVFDARKNEAGVGELLDIWRADGTKVIVTETNNRRGEGSRVE